MVEFEWDEEKAQANLVKHGVSFPAASRVFEDDARIEWIDSRKDYGEPRYATIGLVNGRCLFVAYTERGACLRLIMARRATRRERREYHGHRKV